MEDTRDFDFVTFEIWVLVLAALLLVLMTFEWSFCLLANVLHNIAK